jgi:hypothetical protein
MLTNILDRLIMQISEISKTSTKYQLNINEGLSYEEMKNIILQKLNYL